MPWFYYSVVILDRTGAVAGQPLTAHPCSDNPSDSPSRAPPPTFPGQPRLNSRGLVNLHSRKLQTTLIIKQVICDPSIQTQHKISIFYPIAHSSVFA
ncbi:hypothetical protein BDZ91DRAFT_337681 [Kalaharituber pfeilii]|nr:hypothetical protein BDZ91DRAFT_337681 [Kalaharituber pfeilii]